MKYLVRINYQDYLLETDRLSDIEAMLKLVKISVDTTEITYNRQKDTNVLVGPFDGFKEVDYILED